ncbi:UNVERIFIED_CONTAM: hypothetical protein FKN15_037959 [Acipenser sinensis]
MGKITTAPALSVPAKVQQEPVNSKMLLFGNTLTLYYINPNGTESLVPLQKKGIAWWTDKNVKFRNPGGNNLNLTAVFQGTSKPVNWRKPVYELDTDPENNGFINEDFIVWMRTAALPTFRKLYRLIEKKNNMIPTLQRGNYTLEITYSILSIKITWERWE